MFCAGILGNHYVGQFFIEGYVNGDTYINILQEFVDPMITEVLENDGNLL